MTESDLPRSIPVDRAARFGPRSKAVLAGLLAAAAVGGGTVAVAGNRAVTRYDNGVVGIDGRELTPWYRGHAVTLDQIEDLDRDGKTLTGINSIELACHGISLYVQDEAELNAYDAGYRARANAVAAKRRALVPGTDPADTDPCAWWKGPIPEVPSAPQAP